MAHRRMRDLAMARLEQLACGSTMRGLAPTGIAKVISVECFSQQAAKVTFEDTAGRGGRSCAYCGRPASAHR
jgi:hypothetical protein